MMPTVSLILPNRNHADELETSLGCIVRQSRPYDEIVVVDDASTDHSLEVIARFAAQHPNMRLLRNERRLGVAATVNRGIREARCDYVVLASADERTEASMCQALTEAVERFPDLRLAVSVYAEWDAASGTEIVHDKASPLGMWYAPADELAYISPGQFERLLRRRFVWLGINTAIYHRRTLLAAGGLDPALKWHSDWFAIYAVAFRHGFATVPRRLATFQRSPLSYSADGMRDARAQEEIMVNIHRKLDAPENGDLRRAICRSPAALSPFMRSMIPALAKRPAYYRRLAPIVWWWLGEVIRGRRPAALVRCLARWRPPRSAAPTG